MTTEEHPPAQAEGNIFCVSPQGFRGHIKLSSPSVSILRNMNILADALETAGWRPDVPALNGFSRPQEGQQQQQSAGPSGVAEWVINNDGSRLCSVHGPAKFVPPGVSKRTGQPFSGFWACQVRGCKPRGED